MPETTKRSWPCRWIERLRQAHPEWEQGADKPGILQGWVERHEARCRYCRAEREVWSRALAALRSREAGAAPAHILDGVLARIARERAAGALGRVSKPPAPVPEVGRFAWPARSGAWDLGEIVLWASGAVAIGWAASVRVSAWTAWWSARAQLWESVQRWAGEARSGWNAFAAALEAVSPGIQPYLAAGLWCAVGLSAAAASVALAARFSER